MVNREEAFRTALIEVSRELAESERLRAELEGKLASERARADAYRRELVGYPRDLATMSKQPVTDAQVDAARAELAAPPAYQKPLEPSEPSTHCLKLPKPSEKIIRPGDAVRLLDGTEAVFKSTDPKNDWRVTLLKGGSEIVHLALSDFYAKVDPA